MSIVDQAIALGIADPRCPVRDRRIGRWPSDELDCRENQAVQSGGDAEAGGELGRPRRSHPMVRRSLGLTGWGRSRGRILRPTGRARRCRWSAMSRLQRLSWSAARTIAHRSAKPSNTIPHCGCAAYQQHWSRCPQASHGGLAARPSQSAAKAAAILAWFERYRSGWSPAPAPHAKLTSGNEPCRTNGRPLAGRLIEEQLAAFFLVVAQRLAEGLVWPQHAASMCDGKRRVSNFKCTRVRSAAAARHKVSGLPPP